MKNPGNAALAPFRNVKYSRRRSKAGHKYNILYNTLLWIPHVRLSYLSFLTDFNALNGHSFQNLFGSSKLPDEGFESYNPNIIAEFKTN